MKLLFAPILIGTLVLAGTLPASAQSKPDNGISVGVATTHDPAAERNSYTQQAHGEMQMWEQKLHDFDAKAESKAAEAQASASKDLQSAWTETKMAWSELVKVGENVGTAGATDWDSAKASFKTASSKLAVAWNKVNPADK